MLTSWRSAIEEQEPCVTRSFPLAWLIGNLGTVGVTVRVTRWPKGGQTPHDVIWQRGRARLLRYRSDYIRWRPPLLLVYSLVAPCQW
jgi:hypothetical protein